ncbi:ArsC family reductase [Celerinatantimonas diazotrophica]|uniref:Spx/MgsR family transcriptional regulator n=1 Tax=Celerinatantimonas diazotrophica TaxID=412034 RepID=A0A4R1K5M6_9GAMM|nr:ArsC family reductase [Celerinatantimonas diazotrophica]TCK59053.1 Spx/MgsR family transcriptional regulator [Celerinatantimonas diazotrophica]CAG9297688.1 Protein YffB [Celerinatantimonas diazotrophica]
MNPSDVIMYGIPNCDTIKKARHWLSEQQINYQFHDYRKDGLSRDLLEQFEAQLGWQALLNKRGTTYRKLPDEQKNALDKESAITLMLEQPAMIKRPLLARDGQYLLGFKDTSYTEFFSEN